MLANNNRKLADAVVFITRALAEEPDNPAYLDSLGWAYYRLQQFQLALPPLEKAATAVPESSVIQDHLGDLYLSSSGTRTPRPPSTVCSAGDGDGVIQARHREEARPCAARIKATSPSWFRAWRFVPSS